MTNKTTNFSLQQLHDEGLAVFIDNLGRSEQWLVYRKNNLEQREAVGMFDTNNGLLYSSDTQVFDFLAEHQIVEIRDHVNASTIGWLDYSTGLIWRPATAEHQGGKNNQSTNFSHLFSGSVGSTMNKHWGELLNSEWDLQQKSKIDELGDFRLPSQLEFFEFYLNKNNGLSDEQNGTLRFIDGANHRYWPTARGAVDLKKEETGLTVVDKANKHKKAFMVSEAWRSRSPQQINLALIEQGWILVSSSGEATFLSRKWCDLSMEKLAANMVLENIELQAKNNELIRLNPADTWIDTKMIEIDYKSCRLPQLSETQLTDPDKGLWELWGQSDEASKKFGYIARDPLLDIQTRPVAIDFGTSSTVVGVTNQNGGQELLRIGVRDFYQPVAAQHFENPTVLEFLDFNSFTEVWNEQAYRPELNWNWVRASHEAQESFRDNPGDTEVLASMLPRIKQWALRSDVDRRIKLTGRKGQELELQPHMERNPVRGQQLRVSADHPLDPVELYAWYLGMAINWRGRGLFLKYYLSFPVKYPLDVRNRILASFRRGLQRSLPHSLVSHYPHILNDFEVNDLASEPAAYAAAALPHLGIEPTETGVPYAVFDFGGGTSDFDYGILRWANDEEEAQGFERVFEHVGSGGDNFLGAENLLEHLVYETFKLNQDSLRQAKIQFTMPMDAVAFSGSELLIANTQAAQTNMVMLSAKLREFMESDSAVLSPQIRLDLLDANSKKKPCELQLDADLLDTFLAQRIQGGVYAFFSQLANVIDKLPAVPVQVLLAGNGSRSRHIQSLLSNTDNQLTDILAEVFGPNPPEIKVHAPLPMDDKNPHAPTSKTGVALGLLKLTPGRGVLIKNESQERQDGQAPFGWFVGRISRNKFKQLLTPDVDYQEWMELGVIHAGVFNLYTTKSPRAIQGLADGSPELVFHPLSLPDAMTGAKLFVRAKSPGLIELAHSADMANLTEATILELNLEKR